MGFWHENQTSGWCRRRGWEHVRFAEVTTMMKKQRVWRKGLLAVVSLLACRSPWHAQPKVEVDLSSLQRGWSIYLCIIFYICILGNSYAFIILKPNVYSLFVYSLDSSALAGTSCMHLLHLSASNGMFTSLRNCFNLQSAWCLVVHVVFWSYGSVPKF